MPLSLNAPAPECAPEVTLQELTSVDELQVLEPEWFNLWQIARATPFQSPAWLIPWARHFTGDNLRVLTVRSRRELVALAPFYVWEKKLFLLGNGISDYLDLLIHPRCRDLVRPTLLDWFESSCELNQLPENSALVEFFPALESEPTHLLAPISAIPKEQLTKCRYYERRAARQGRVQFLRADLHNCREVLQTLFALHAARWRERGESGVLADPNVQSFHLEAAERFAAAGLLRLYSLLLNDTTIAVLHAFADTSRTYYYLSGFNPEFHLLSPGALLIGHAIREATSEGHTEFDFLRGSEPYKAAWGAQPRKTLRILS